MLEPADQPPTTIEQALLIASERVYSDKTIENAYRMLARGNALELRVLVDLQQCGAARVVVKCRERSREWVIFLAKNLEPETQETEPS